MVRWNSSWLSAVTWSEISRSRSRNRSANSSRLRVESSGTPLSADHEVVSSTAPALVSRG